MTMPPTPGEIPYINEVKRKAIHLFALVMPVGYFFVPRPWALGLLLAAFLISLTLDVLRIFKLRAYALIQPAMGTVLRPQEDRDFTGATYILFAGFFCYFAFSIPAAAAGMGFIILGDTAAALVGRRWGRHKFGNKSYEGSLAFFACATLWAVILPGISLTWGLAAAALATVVEATSGLIDDNVSVPLVCAAFLHFVPGWV
jgi:dolichol kinase